MADRVASPPDAAPSGSPGSPTDDDVKEWVKGLGRTKDGSVPSDDVFNKNIQSHEGSYTKILEAYESNIQETLTKKTKYKPKVFWLSFSILIGACILILLLTGALVVKAFMTNELSLWIATVTETLLAFLATFIVIPQVITNYLFNTEEEKYMSEIIKSIQTYDKERVQAKNGLNSNRKDE